MQDAHCEGISLPDDQKVKISQFADDTTIIMENVESLKLIYRSWITLELITLFCFVIFLITY